MVEMVEGNKIYASDLLKNLSQFRRKNLFCDVTLVVHGREFPAHRGVLAAGCEYFRALFTNMSEKCCDRVVLDLSADVLEDILNFIYTGEIFLDAENVMEIIITADYLIVCGAKEKAAEFLQSLLTTSNCLQIREFADKYSCLGLGRAADDMIAMNFGSIFGMREFGCMGVEALGSLISRDDVIVESEADIYEAVLSWVKHDLQKRRIHLVKLLRKIRFSSLSKELVKVQLQREPLITSDQACVNLLCEWLRSRGTAISQPRKCLSHEANAVLVVGGLSAGRPQKTVLAYLPGNNRWLKLQDMTSEREEHAVVTWGDFLYVIGGYPRGKSVERYDPRTNTWSAVPDLLERTFASAAVAVNDKIYVLGGKDGFQAMSTVQCYDPNTNAWSLVRPMKHARKALCAAVVHGCIYAIGGCTFDNNSLTVVEKFTLETGEWTEVKPLNQQRKYACAEVLNNRIVVIGGYQESSQFALQSCEVYSPEVDEWYPLASMIIPRAGAGAARVEGNIYVLGGRHDRCNIYTVDCFDTETNQWLMHDRCGYGLCTLPKYGVTRLPKHLLDNLK